MAERRPLPPKEYSKTELLQKAATAPFSVLVCAFAGLPLLASLPGFLCRRLLLKQLFHVP